MTGPAAPAGEAIHPALPLAERAYQHALAASLALLGFFVLYSTAGTALAMAALLVLCLLAPRRLWALAAWREPVIAIGLVLLAYIALRTLLGDGLVRRSAATINSYHELLLLPLLWSLLRIARRPRAFELGLWAGAAVLAALFWVAPWLPAAADFLATRRISAGFGLSLCAFLLFEHARLGALPRAFGYGGAAVLAATLLFAGDSRTGHLLVLLLAGCAAWRAAPARWRLRALLAVVAAGVLLASLSPAVRGRIDETLQATQASRHGEVAFTSSGARIELVRNSVAVAREHWLLGTGWPGFGPAYAQAAAERGVNSPQGLGARSDNPHNEYLMQLAAGGLPALLLFLLWVGAPLWRAVRTAPRHDAWSGTVACVALAFAVGSLFNSLLLDFVEGHVYAALLAWLLARPAATGAR